MSAAEGTVCEDKPPRAKYTHTSQTLPTCEKQNIGRSHLLHKKNILESSSSVVSPFLHVCFCYVVPFQSNRAKPLPSPLCPMFIPRCIFSHTSFFWKSEILVSGKLMSHPVSCVPTLPLLYSVDVVCEQIVHF